MYQAKVGKKWVEAGTEWTEANIMWKSIAIEQAEVGMIQAKKKVQSRPWWVQNRLKVNEVD